jgi:hypothetical protein
MTDISKSASSHWKKKINPANKQTEKPSKQQNQQAKMFYQVSFQIHIKIWCFSQENLALGSCDNVEMAEKWILLFHSFLYIHTSTILCF